MTENQGLPDRDGVDVPAVARVGPHHHLPDGSGRGAVHPAIAGGAHVSVTVRATSPVKAPIGIGDDAWGTVRITAAGPQLDGRGRRDVGVGVAVDQRQVQPVAGQPTLPYAPGVTSWFLSSDRRGLKRCGRGYRRPQRRSGGAGPGAGENPGRPV